MALAPYTSGDK